MIYSYSSKKCQTDNSSSLVMSLHPFQSPFKFTHPHDSPGQQIPQVYLFDFSPKMSISVRGIRVRFNLRQSIRRKNSRWTTRIADPHFCVFRLKRFLLNIYRNHSTHSRAVKRWGGRHIALYLQIEWFFRCWCITVILLFISNKNIARRKSTFFILRSLIPKGGGGAWLVYICLR